MIAVSIYGTPKLSSGGRSFRDALSVELDQKVFFISDTPKKAPKGVVINWGNSHKPTWFDSVQWLNSPLSTVCAINKSIAFDYWKSANVSCPEFTQDLNQVRSWLNNGYIVLARTKLSAAGGQGIVVLRKNDPIVDAALFVKYVPKDLEYRIHILKHKVIDYAQKKRSSESEQTKDQKLIRSHDNGWIFCREDVTIPDEAAQLAIQATQALGLDFGAVDLIRDRDRNVFVALEVNTRPGLEGQTVVNYAKAFKEFLCGVSPVMPA
jgi:hypothetical protein